MSQAILNLTVTMFSVYQIDTLPAVKIFNKGKA